MTLNPIGPNVNEVYLGGGLTILFSYKTPVACAWTNGKGITLYKTAKKWSKTTSKHVNKWLSIWTLPEAATEKPQEYFDSLLSGVKL
jgi:hypothetical protein